MFLKHIIVPPRYKQLETTNQFQKSITCVAPMTGVIRARLAAPLIRVQQNPNPIRRIGSHYIVSTTRYQKLSVGVPSNKRIRNLDHEQKHPQNKSEVLRHFYKSYPHSDVAPQTQLFFTLTKNKLSNAHTNL